ncbi:MAG TPA: DUF4412 domain-containing protein, partial [Polyangiaceae bacterium]|nr:DUF4412 domain-containing protein [Polyangiaceae bacterium]
QVAKAAAAPPSAAQQQAPIAGNLATFEGEIGLALSSANEPDKARTMTLLVKDGQLRFNVPAPMGKAAGAGDQGLPYQIINVAQGKVYSVMDKQKMVVETDAKSLADQVKSWSPGQKPDSSKKPPTVTKTGKKDTVAGFSCEEWDVTTERGAHERVCVANDSAAWLKFPFSDLPADQTWAKELFDGAHFPVRFVSTDDQGKELHRVEVSKLERKPLAADLFTIPADYRRMDMNAMMGGLQNLRSMGAGAGSAGAQGSMQPGKMPPAVEEMLRKMKEKSATKH